MLTMKLIIVGDINVGKTSLINSYLQQPTGQNSCTINCDFSYKYIELANK